jgi:hypothetical protein
MCKEKRRRSFSLVARGCVTLIARSVGGSNQCFGGSLIHPPTAGSGYLKESELENRPVPDIWKKKLNRETSGDEYFKTRKESPGFRKEPLVLSRLFTGSFRL